MEDWYVTHIYTNENYLMCGPHSSGGEPKECHHFCCEECANVARDILNREQSNG